MINNLIFSKCECGKSTAPPRAICPKCGKKMKDTKISNIGNVYSFTTLYSVQEGFSSPLKLVIVELKNNVKILCEYIGDEDLKIGQKGLVKKKDSKYEFEI